MQYRATAKLDSLASWLSLVILTMVYTSGYMNRQVLNLLVPQMKTYFGIGDLEVSLALGAAFTASLIIAGPFFGRLCDVASRRKILAAGVVMWTIFSIMAAFVTSYGGLMVARFGLGAAEACIYPACYSLLADYFSPAKLPRAMAIFFLSPYLGSGLSLMFGGWVTSASGYGVLHQMALILGRDSWQLTILLIALPGFILAAMTLFVVEQDDVQGSGPGSNQLTFGQSCQIITRRSGVYGPMFGAMALQMMFVFAFPAWLPSFLNQRFDAGLAEVGMSYGIVTLLLGVCGTLIGPIALGWLHRRIGDDAPLRLAIASQCSLSAVSLLFFIVDDYNAALALIGAMVFFSSVPLASMAAALQGITPRKARGFVSACYTVTATGFGLGAGPTIVAATMNLFDPTAVGIGYALGLVGSISGSVAATLLMSAVHNFRIVSRNQEIGA